MSKNVEDWLPDTPRARNRYRKWYCTYCAGMRVEITESHGEKIVQALDVVVIR